VNSQELTYSDLARLGVKGGKKLLSKTSKPTSSTISSPPKAAIAGSNAKKDEVQRHRNPLNDILRRRSGDDTVAGSDTPTQDVALGTTRPSEAAAGTDVRMAERIAELERALNVAREEQHVMREELGKIKQFRHAERDASGDTPRQLGYTNLNTQDFLAHESSKRGKGIDHHDGSPGSKESLEVPQMPNHQLHSDQSMDAILRQNSDLRHKVAQLEQQLGPPEVAYHSNPERVQSHREAEWNELRSRLHMTEKESQERLHQLLLLKSSISSLTRPESQITDSELADSFIHLSNRVREWVISNFRRSKMDAENLPPETIKTLKLLTPAYASIEKTDRLALYQALVSSAMMQVFEEPLVVGLPHTGSLSAIRSFAESIQGSGSDYREWRRATVRAIKGSAAEKPLEQEKNDMLHRIAGEIAHLLFTLTSISLSTNAQAALMSILSAAVDLQRTIVLQKARYKMLFFRNSESNCSCAFDDRRMESVNDLDSTLDDDCDMLDDRLFAFCIFPCLEKFGDEWGDNLEVSNILLKAKVCCGVG
jgi:hypothetical protein